MNCGYLIIDEPKDISNKEIVSYRKRIKRMSKRINELRR